MKCPVAINAAGTSLGIKSEKIEHEVELKITIPFDFKGNVQYGRYVLKLIKKYEDYRKMNFSSNDGEFTYKAPSKSAGMIFMAKLKKIMERRGDPGTRRAPTHRLRNFLQFGLTVL